MSGVSKQRATFGTTRKNVPGVQERALKMYNGMTANAATFALPTITMVVLLALMTALGIAQQNAKSLKSKGLATLRNAKCDALWTAMGILRAYVQGVADAASAENAAFIIEAGGLLVAKAAQRQKAVLKAMLAATAGVVHLDANASALVGPAGASKKVTFNWQWSGDGGKTWNNASATPYAETDVTGLALMTVYSFRVSVTVGKVTEAWSQAVSLLVH